MSNRAHARPKLPAVLGGQPTWVPEGVVEWWQWGATKPRWDPMLNCLDPDAIEWPMRTPETVVAAARVAAGLWAHDGPREREVEEQLRQALDVLDVTMVTSGTAALRVMYRALMAWGRLHGRKVTGKPRVIMSKLTFQATAAAAVDSGLAVDMVDVDPVTLLPTTEAIRAAITPDTVGIVDVLLYASVPPLDERRALADEFGLWYGVDGAQGPFARYKGRPVEAYCHAVTKSKQYGKEVTCGEGGVASSNIPLVATLVRLAVVGKEPARLPEWWATEELDRLQAITPGRVRGIQADNVRFDEFRAGVLLEQLRLRPAQARRKEEQYARLVRGLARRGLPFEIVQRTGSGFIYKVGLWNRTRIPTPVLLQAARIQMTGEWGGPYVPMDNPDSGFKPQTIPWQTGQLDDQLITVDPVELSVAADAHAKVMLLAGNELLRFHAAEHVLDTLERLAAYPDELIRWGQTLVS